MLLKLTIHIFCCYYCTFEQRIPSSFPLFRNMFRQAKNVPHTITKPLSMHPSARINFFTSHWCGTSGSSYLLLPTGATIRPGGCSWCLQKSCRCAGFTVLRQWCLSTGCEHRASSPGHETSHILPLRARKQIPSVCKRRPYGRYATEGNG